MILITFVITDNNNNNITLIQRNAPNKYLGQEHAQRKLKIHAQIESCSKPSPYTLQL